MFTNEATRDTATRILNYIHNHPEVHNQYYLIMGLDEDKPLSEDTSICGTAMCVAGTAVFFRAVDTNRSINAVLEEDTDDDYGDGWYTIAGPMLGLENETEFYWLFEDMDNASALKKLKSVANGKITNLDRFGNVLDEEDSLV